MKTKSLNIRKVLEFIFILNLFFFSFYFRLYPLEASHYWDETVYLQNANVLLNNSVTYSELDYRPPFISLLIAIGSELSNNDYSAQILISVINSLGIVGLYLLARKLLGLKVAILSCIFLAFSPQLITEAHMIMTDSPAMSLLVISLLFFYYGCDFDKKQLFLFSGVILSCGILTKFTLLLFVMLFPVLFYIHKISCRNFFYFSLGLTLPLAIYLVISQIAFGFFLFPFIKAQMIINGSPPEPFYFYFFEVPLKLDLMVIIGFFIGFIFIVRSLIDRNKNKDLLIFFVTFFVFLIYLSIIVHKEFRYLFPIIFIFAIISAYGYCSLIDNISAKKSVQAAMLILLIIGFFYINFDNLNNKMMLPEVNIVKTGSVLISEYIQRNIPVNTTIYSITNFPVLSYYSKRTITPIYFINETKYPNLSQTLDSKKAIYIYKDILRCDEQQFDDSAIDKSGYLLLYSSEDYENTHIAPKLRNCPYLKLIKQNSEVALFKFDFNAKKPMIISKLPSDKRITILAIESPENAVNISALLSFLNYIEASKKEYSIGIIPNRLNDINANIKLVLKHSNYANIYQIGYKHNVITNGALASEFQNSSFKENNLYLSKGKMELESEFNRTIKSFCPPFYYSNENLRHSLEQLNYSVYLSSPYDNFDSDLLNRYDYNILFANWQSNKMIVKNYSEIINEISDSENRDYNVLVIPASAIDNHTLLDFEKAVLYFNDSVFMSLDTANEWFEFVKKNFVVKNNVINLSTVNIDKKFIPFLSFEIIESGNYTLVTDFPYNVTLSFKNDAKSNAIVCVEKNCTIIESNIKKRIRVS